MPCTLNQIQGDVRDATITVELVYLAYALGEPSYRILTPTDDQEREIRGELLCFLNIIGKLHPIQQVRKEPRGADKSTQRILDILRYVFSIPTQPIE